ncbi:alpha/beta hydrolase [Paenibacillus pinistramenti]|uniref:alpha/beta hydrolase n=1 Tax=Paenibacillus pinistramenti TaxID=1768003 RepID=UPI001EF051DA|nr:alpha/beta hydrolase [Paenibacillus pinistramenti]
MNIDNNLGTYAQTERYWEKYQHFFPEELRIHDGCQPVEEWWNRKDGRIHIDRWPAADSSLKVILIHGAGGNSRLLAPYARMLQLHGYETAAPDLPPYGLSGVHSPKMLSYPYWIELLTDLIQREAERDGKAVVLLGVSIGGMLAYHTAAAAKNVKGLIATTFADTRDPAVRDQLAPNRLISRAGKRAMDALPFLLDSIQLPVNLVSRMKHISNNPRLASLIMDDPRAAGIRMPVQFLRTFMSYKPAVNPESFDKCPVLLIHPELDPMTPYPLSEAFYKRLQGTKQCVILEGAGHLPIEQPGLDQMRTAVLSFLNTLK